MKESMTQLQPPEVRILKHILQIEDPAERRSTLEEAFTPGPEIATEKEDFLCTCAWGLGFGLLAPPIASRPISSVSLKSAGSRVRIV